jgi:hypothetical protein
MTDLGTEGMGFSIALLIGSVGAIAWLAIAWRKRRERALRREMKRHLQVIGASVMPYDATS